jgi:hypothetical protein
MEQITKLPFLSLLLIGNKENQSSIKQACAYRQKDSIKGAPPQGLSDTGIDRGWSQSPNGYEGYDTSE